MISAAVVIDDDRPGVGWARADRADVCGAVAVDLGAVRTRVTVWSKSGGLEVTSGEE